MKIEKVESPTEEPTKPKMSPVVNNNVVSTTSTSNNSPRNSLISSCSSGNNNVVSLNNNNNTSRKMATKFPSAPGHTTVEVSCQFNWDDYLKEFGGKPAPPYCFKQVSFSLKITGV